jgi:hypothetical protein
MKVVTHKLPPLIYITIGYWQYRMWNQQMAASPAQKKLGKSA